MQAPQELLLLESEVAVRWPDGTEHYLPHEYLREKSPSAENQGETDIFGRVYGGTGPRKFPGVTVQTWDYVGNYAVRFIFSDGHATGLYSWPYLRKIGEEWRAEE